MLYTYSYWDSCLRSAPIRDESQSTMMSASAGGAGGCRTRSAPGKNRLSSRTGSLDTMATCLPRRVNPHSSASMDPRQSGSGSTWHVMTSESCRSSAAAMAANESAGVIGLLLLSLRHDGAKQAVDAVAPLNGIVQSERDLRRVTQPDAPAEFAADKALRVEQRRQRVLFFRCVAEYAD